MNEQFDFCSEKNRWLKEHRAISFEEIITAIEIKGLLDVISHPNQEKYPHQKMYVVDLDDYVHIVPFIRKDKQTVFLKTIFKSRKMTKQYLVDQKGDNTYV